MWVFSFFVGDIPQHRFCLQHRVLGCGPVAPSSLQTKNCSPAISKRCLRAWCGHQMVRWLLDVFLFQMLRVWHSQCFSELCVCVVSSDQRMQVLDGSREVRRSHDSHNWFVATNSRCCFPLMPSRNQDDQELCSSGCLTCPTPSE